jgi:hypothetical protein
MIGTLSRTSSCSLTASRYLIWLTAFGRRVSIKKEREMGCITAVKDGYFACLLVGGREGFLEASIAFPELVASSLLGLDGLLGNRFAAGVTRSIGRGNGTGYRVDVCGMKEQESSSVLCGKRKEATAPLLVVRSEGDSLVASVGWFRCR